MKNKKLAVAIVALCYAPLAFAGGILTNTNQSARFARYMALEASTNIDAAYYNPAGLSKLNDGFHVSFSNQSAFQKRQITSNFPLYAGDQGAGKGNTSRFYEGTASAPIIPSLQAAYKKGKWTLSGSLAVVGGGGKATFNNGLSMFESGAAMMPLVFAQLNGKLQDPSTQLPPSVINRPTLAAQGYTIDQYMTGSNFIYGAQLGGTYKINDMFSVYGGFRLNIVNNHYKGYLKGLTSNLTTTGLNQLGMQDYDGTKMVSPEAILALGSNMATEKDQINSLNLLSKAASKDGAQLDSKQSGWGVAPIIGFNFTWKNLNIGTKYEFKTNLDVENKTKIDDTGKNKDGIFASGASVAHDIPALFTIGAEYQILPQLKAAVGYHHFFDRSAKMADNKQNHISGTNEYLAGIEYQIDRMFLVSMGGQITKYGIKDQKFQSDLSFSVNSYSLGIGGAVNVAKNVQINVGYFFTDYEDYNTSDVKAVLPNGSKIVLDNTYTRKNKVFSAGVEFSF